MTFIVTSPVPVIRSGVFHREGQLLLGDYFGKVSYQQDVCSLGTKIDVSQV